MLFDPARHEPLADLAWDEGKARAAIAWIVSETEREFSDAGDWPRHPNDDGRAKEPACSLYMGASGVIWALAYLEALGAARLERSYAEHVEPLLARNRARLDAGQHASYLIGDTGIELLRYWLAPSSGIAARLQDLAASNLDNPARELMWGVARDDARGGLHARAHR
jgi:hypothetical protein